MKLTSRQRVTLFEGKHHAIDELSGSFGYFYSRECAVFWLEMLQDLRNMKEQRNGR